MGRPALSASRSLDVLDLLTASPHKSFTFAEIRRGLAISPSSCWAVVNELARRGYLLKNPTRRSYTLGPVLIAAGASALKSQPLAQHAAQAIEQLARDLGVPVILNAVSGDEIVTVFSVPDQPGRGTAPQVGKRLPLQAPLGAPFFAWAAQEDIESWIARNAASRDRDVADEWRRALAVMRKRGYQLTLRLLSATDFALLMEQMASGAEAERRPGSLVPLFERFDRSLIQPDEVGDDESYDVVSISAPIFDNSGAAVFAVGLGPFQGAMTGSEIRRHADRLVSTCLKVMQASRQGA